MLDLSMNAVIAVKATVNVVAYVFSGQRDGWAVLIYNVKSYHIPA
jgi:hypothetical protein